MLDGGLVPLRQTERARGAPHRGRGKRVTKPLAATQRTLKETVQWAKERLA